MSFLQRLLETGKNRSQKTKLIAINAIEIIQKLDHILKKV